MKLHRFKLIETPFNPQYMKKVTWFDTEEEAVAAKRNTWDKPCTAEIVEVDYSVPEEMYKFIRSRLQDRSEQFCDLPLDEQLEDIALCYAAMSAAMDQFHDSRYAY